MTQTLDTNGELIYNYIHQPHHIFKNIIIKHQITNQLLVNIIYMRTKSKHTYIIIISLIYILSQEFRNRYLGGWVTLALSHPFSSGQTKSNPWDTIVGNFVAQALADFTARASGPSDFAWGIRVHDPHPSKDHPWYEHCRSPFSSILPSYPTHKMAKTSKPTSSTAQNQVQKRN